MNLIARNLEGGVWRTNKVEVEPKIELHLWKVLEADGTRHFVGYSFNGQEGRVSSRIMKYNRASRTGITGSGRHYQLMGPPGSHEDADYVWDRWTKLNGIENVKDVTHEY
jgi:hypothetical protein